ncbi:pyridoxal phosphate-dependent transferase [Aspergillus aurantiobrunneus]
MDHSKRIKRYFETRTKGQNGVLKDIMATSNQDHAILVGDNDYLNLVHHKDVLTKQAEDFINSTYNEATDNIRSSVFLSDFDPHTALEADLGRWYGKDCYLAQSGYAANVGVMHAVCTPDMHVYVDQMLHMSFYDGLAARGVKIHFFKPNSAPDLESKIKKHGPGLIIVESIYSTSGAFAPLEEIVRIKKSHGCLLAVDESHSFGLFGPQGLGLLHTKNLVHEVEYITASLAKAYATRAGIVFSTNASYVKEHSYPFIFSSGLVQNDIVRIRAIWEVIKAADDRRERLIKVSTFFRQEMNKVCRVVGGLENTPCAIVWRPHEERGADG